MKLPDLIDALTILRDQMTADGSPYLAERDVEIELEGEAADELEVGFYTPAEADTGLPDHSFAEWVPGERKWERYG